VALAACSSSESSSDGGSNTDGSMNVPDGQTPGDSSTSDSPMMGSGLSAKYPCDMGIDKDPAVVFTENFEEGSVSAVTARYEDKKPGGITLATDVPPKSCGKASGKFYADPNAPAADLFKKLTPGFDELWVRYYAKYQKGIQWHHTGVWIGGYNPASNYPNPQAGLKPNGDDRFSVSYEPSGADGSPNTRMDFYNYWMTMHSWMDMPMGNTAYYGNSLVHMKSSVAPDDTWMCVEIHIKLNPNPSNGSGAELDLWVNGNTMAHFDDKAPVGCWIRDKFCATGWDGPECNYPNLCMQPYIPLDLQWRSTAALNLNAFWPQNYITAGPGGSVEYDDMVVAKSAIGCIQ
jgi:hypothetical protein